MKCQKKSQNFWKGQLEPLMYKDKIVNLECAKNDQSFVNDQLFYW